MNISLSLKRIPYCKLISQIANHKKINIWLVGGFLRDAYLKVDKHLTDFDFCIEKKASSFAGEFARKINAKYIVLDKQNQSFRVILKKRKIIYTYDFTLIRGKTISDDLSLRDFSINSLAVDLRAKRKKIIDYWGARKDLNRKLLITTRKEAILHDPLRILRGFSIFANYGFRIEAKTLEAMKRYKKMINDVSPERITEELFKILRSVDSFKAIKLMDETRIIDEFIPAITKARGLSQGDYHHLDVWSHSLETLKKFELLYRKQKLKNSKIFSYLEEKISSGRRRVQIIKLACILHDIGKPSAKKNVKGKMVFYSHEKIGRDLSEEIADSLKFASKEKELLKKLVFWHLRPGYLAGQTPLTSRAVYRFFRDTQNEGISVVLLSLSDWRATRGPLITEQRRKKYERVMINLAEMYFSLQKQTSLKKIIDGHWLMKKLKIESGPLVGKILKAVQEEQALGIVSNKKDVYKIARTIANQHQAAVKHKNTKKMHKKRIK